MGGLFDSCCDCAGESDDVCAPCLDTGAGCPDGICNFVKVATANVTAGDVSGLGIVPINFGIENNDGTNVNGQPADSVLLKPVGGTATFGAQPKGIYYVNYCSGAFNGLAIAGFRPGVSTGELESVWWVTNSNIIPVGIFSIAVAANGACIGNLAVHSTIGVQPTQAACVAANGAGGQLIGPFAHAGGPINMVGQGNRPTLFAQQHLLGIIQGGPVAGFDINDHTGNTGILAATVAGSVAFSLHYMPLPPVKIGFVSACARWLTLGSQAQVTITLRNHNCVCYSVTASLSGVSATPATLPANMPPHANVDFTFNFPASNVGVPVTLVLNSPFFDAPLSFPVFLAPVLSVQITKALEILPGCQWYWTGPADGTVPALMTITNIGNWQISVSSATYSMDNGVQHSADNFFCTADAWPLTIGMPPGQLNCNGGTYQNDRNSAVAIKKPPTTRSSTMTIVINEVAGATTFSYPPATWTDVY